MKKILIIGGSGTWSGRTYIPSIKQSNCDVSLVGILDPVNPYYSPKTITHFEYLNKNNVKWVETGKDCDKELVERCIVEMGVDIVIISTPPKFHYEYTMVSLKCGVDVICDKPIIATPAQSSLLEKALVNIQKHNHLLQAIRESYNPKARRRCFVLTPLRRKLQEPYINLYDSVKFINEVFEQDVTNISITHNDGVFRFSDEVELEYGSHGYSEGFGKLTHTGYHVLNVVSGFIEFGCDVQNVECVCKIINCKTVGDMLKSNSNRVNAKLLQSNARFEDISDIALNAEMDIAISYTLCRGDEKFCNIIVDLIHCGRSNRTLRHYDFNNYNDQGRTNELTMHIQQGSLFSSQLILDTMSGSGGTIGEGYMFKNYHPIVAEILKQKQVQILDLKKQPIIPIVDFVSDFYELICKGNLDGYYSYIDFLGQSITDELYISALIAKTNDAGVYRWNLGNIK